MIKEPEGNLFMMCEKLNREALGPLPKGYRIRSCRPQELGWWKQVHFDSPTPDSRAFMDGYFEEVYRPREEEFFRECLVVCDGEDRPVGTCFAWRVYGGHTTIHWYKVEKSMESLGLGRALLSAVMEKLEEGDYPVFLHTHPGCYRAIKLYSDFGFALLTDPVIGYRQNDLEESLPYLQAMMPKEAFERLQETKATEAFLQAARTSEISQF